MDLASQFKDLVGDLSRFREEMTTLEKSVDDPTLRKLLQDLGQQWDEQSGQLKQAFPKALSEMDEQQTRIKSMLDEAHATAAQAQQELDKGIDEEPSGLDMPAPPIEAPNGDML